MSTTTTVNDDEIAKFSKMADEWWDPNGKFKPLHKFHPVRLSYIREQAAIHFGKDMNARYPLEGLRILDIGCGGGLLSEPMARLGAQVVGADAAERNITIAKLHAEQSGVAVDYRATSAEALAQAGEQFDIVLNMEVVEHVDNVPLYMKSCADLVRPGGLQFVATLNRTLRARALAIFAAERVLRWLPVGTHEFEKFLTPEEITALVERNGMSVIDSTGVVYNPFQDAWSRSTDMGINYMILAQKPGLAS